MKGDFLKMKKGKVFSKRHIVTATLVLCLAAAVWLNMRYSSFDTVPENNASNNLGANDYIDSSNLGQAVQTSGAVDKVAASRKERNQNRTETVKTLTAVVNNSTASEKDKKEALDSLQDIADDISAEGSIETVIKAKGFDDALVILSDETVTVIVPSEDLLTSQTLQIQDAVTSQIETDLEKIKIITVK